MARKLIVEILGDASSLQRSYAQAEKSTQQFGRSVDRAGRGALAASLSFRGFGRSIAFASTAFLGGAGLVATLKGAVSAASNLAEQTSKTNVVFADSAQEVLAWSKTTVNSMGLAQDQALETASSFGALLRPLGLTGEAAAKQSKDLTQLGADLASFYNTSVQDALDAIRSGLVGEVEPLRRYGVLLSETRVQQEALHETGKKHVQQLTQQEKVLARITLLYGDSAQAQGDFQRTGEGLANQQRKLAANLRQLQIQLGQALIPEVRKIVAGLNDWLERSDNQRKVTAALADAVTVLKEIVGDVRGAFAGLNAITGSTTNTLRTLFGLFVAFKVAKFAIVFLDLAKSIGFLAPAAKTSAAAVDVLTASELAANSAGLTLAATYAALLALGQRGETSTPRGATIAGAPQRIQAGPAGLISYRDPLTGEYRLVQKRQDETPEQAARRDFRRRHPQGIVGTGAGHDIRDRQPGRSPGGPSPLIFAPATTPGRVTPGFSERQNVWFDARIARMIDVASDAPVRQQLAKLENVARQVRERIAKSIDKTRRLELGDKLRDVLRQQKALRSQLAQDYLDALSFNVDRAAATKTLNDDLAALRAYEAGIEKQIKVAGNTLDLQRQLFDAQQQIATVQQQQREQAAAAREKAAAQRQARQYRLLGLGPEGEELTPGVGRLKKTLASVAKTVEGTFLDTKHTASVLAHIRRILSGGLGAVGKDVRAKVAEILAGIRDQLKEHQVEQTTFAKRSPDAFISALGLKLSPAQTRRLRGALAAAGPNLTLPQSSGQYAGAGATGVVITGPVHVHGVQDIKHLEEQLTKRAKQRPHVRRGAR